MATPCKPRFTRVFGPVALCLFCVMPAFAAQGSKDRSPAGQVGPAAPQGKTPDAGDQTLRGPTVTDRAPPGAAGSFGAPGEPGARERARVQADAFNRAIALLSAQTTDASARLTPQQLEIVNQAQREFRAAEAAFRRDHADELREIRELRRKAGESGGGKRAEAPQDGSKPRAPKQPGPPATDPTPPADMMSAPPAPGADSSGDANAQLMERLRRLEDMRPDPAPFQAKVWGALTEKQRIVVREEMDRIADEALARRQAQRDAQKAPAKKPGDARPNGAKPAKPAPKQAKPKPGAR